VALALAVEQLQSQPLDFPRPYLYDDRDQAISAAYVGEPLTLLGEGKFVVPAGTEMPQGTNPW
jgi:hypothetical protein